MNLAFANEGSGSGSLWASKNGMDWVQILDAPALSGYVPYASNLPDSLVGSSEIFIQARLQSSGLSPLLAQFLPNDGVSTANVFELDANLVPVPEPSSALLALGGLAMLLLRRITSRE